MVTGFQFLRLAQTLRHYGYLRFDACVADFPEKDCPVANSSGAVKPPGLTELRVRPRHAGAGPSPKSRDCRRWAASPLGFDFRAQWTDGVAMPITRVAPGWERSLGRFPSLGQSSPCGRPW